jgi:copper chaperone CopZ
MNKSKLADTAQVQTTTLSIGGMSCGACVRHVTRALDGRMGVVHVDIDLPRNEATIAHLPEQVDAAALVGAVRDAGYQARFVRTVADADPVPSRPVASAGCGCGCCSGPSSTRDAGWSNLGTSTIG